MHYIFQNLLSRFNRTIQSRYFLPVCLLVAIILRIVWIVIFDAQQLSDFRWYYDRGVDLSLSKGYTVDNHPTAFWPVGYPAFLGLLFSLFGPSVLAAKISNVMMYVGILLLSYLIARNLFHSEICARITLLILAIYPNHIAYSSLLSAEILFLFLLLGGITLLMVTKFQVISAVLAGVVFGLGTMTKPQALFVPAVFATIACFTDRKRKKLINTIWQLSVVYLFLAMTLAPWVIRNYKVFHGFTPGSNNDGINLLIGNNPYANGTICNWNEDMKALFGKTGDEYLDNRKAFSMAIQFIIHNPIKVLQLIPRKFFYLYYHDVDGIRWNKAGFTEHQGNYVWWLRLFRFPAQLGYMMIGIFFVLYIIQSYWLSKKGQPQRIPLFGLGIILYFTVTYLVYFGAPRFHFPLIPFVAMYASAFIERIINTFSVNVSSGNR